MTLAELMPEELITAALAEDVCSRPWPVLLAREYARYHRDVLAAALLITDDRQRRASIVARVVRGLDTFVGSYPDDGGCDEGALYWTHAGG